MLLMYLNVNTREVNFPGEEILFFPVNSHFLSRKGRTSNRGMTAKREHHSLPQRTEENVVKTTHC